MVLKDSDFFINVIEICSLTLFNKLFENVWVKANRGDINIFLMVLDCVIKDEQMPFILERKRPILGRKC